ncbi:ABC transporter ATP-binding protein [Acaryochloris sp. IP29b_bin.148]|uniref:ABC transporter ATP-binding protein n=1 Tax=Acaryochloris sp. IP29b_bin.148 TaxID=2969218 RepID=UPI00260D7174|nr:ABC transporter ATP-binding protein [Acaryochloris sp. IP29b_bin.148]
MQLLSKFKRKITQNIRLLPALRLVWDSSPRWTVARVTLVIAQGVLPVATIYLTKLLIDAVSTSLTAVDKTAVFQNCLPILVCLGTITLLTTAFSALAELVNQAHAQRVTDYMQGLIHAKSIGADLEHYENPKYHDLLQRAQQEAPFRPPRILDRLAQVGKNGISLVAMLGLLISLHWSILGVLLVVAIPPVIVKVRYSQVMYRWQRRRTQMQRQGMYLGWMLTTDECAKEIRLFNLGHLFSQRYQNIRQQLYTETVKILKQRSFLYFGTEASAGLVILAIFSFIVYRTIQGHLQIGDLVLYSQALQRGQTNLRDLMKSGSGLYEDNLFLVNLYEFLNLQPKVVDPVCPRPFPLPFQSGIVFKNVSFQYGATTRQALKNINLKIRPGEVVALVGENGSGKTTLIKLLCRLYDPNCGAITIDGVDIREFAIADLRRQISVIFQDYAQYYFTAKENIWLGNVELSIEDERVIRAARLSGADQVIQTLPKTYNTVLGKLFDEGEELSIGQWQKIALARAFLRDSQVIVLDEPTSAMDPKAEYEVFQQFRTLIQDQSAILISHRLSTVKMADYIYVMSQGRIIEEGSHESLLSLDGVYTTMFETQAQNYR